MVLNVTPLLTGLGLLIALAIVVFALIRGRHTA